MSFFLNGCMLLLLLSEICDCSCGRKWCWRIKRSCAALKHSNFEYMLCANTRERGIERKNRWNHRKITNECFTKVGGSIQYISTSSWCLINVDWQNSKNLPLNRVRRIFNDVVYIENNNNIFFLLYISRSRNIILEKISNLKIHKNKEISLVLDQSVF